MKRKIIQIDEELCNGCGLCAQACHEGAIEMVNGKATLTREDYCDGLGDCLPSCPTGAISFIEKEAPAYDEQAVKENMMKKKAGQPLGGEHPHTEGHPFGGCPGSRAHAIGRKPAQAVQPVAAPVGAAESQLAQWPVQIQLVPVNAPYFHNANLLIAADCGAFACGDFHNRFMKNKITIIGCPKLDDVDYSEKLTRIIRENEIKSVTVVRMEVPCCAGIANAAVSALRDSGKMIPWQVVTLTTDGGVLEN